MHDWRIDHPPKIVRFHDTDIMAKYIAAEFIALCRNIQNNGRCVSVVLSGGRTPVLINRQIVKSACSVNWNRVLVFFGDERCVPNNNPDSNFRLNHNTLFQFIPIPESNIFRIKGEKPPEEAAEDYEKEIKQVFKAQSPPIFDLCILGIGADGHTASIFPGREIMQEGGKYVVFSGKGTDGHERVSLTYSVINRSKNIWFVIFGKEKREITNRLIDGYFNPLECPAQGVAPYDGELVYFIEQSVLGDHPL